MNKQFWNSKNVFITGAAGFIGSHLTELLVEKGANVKALVQYNSTSDIELLNYVASEIKDSVDIVFGDVRDSIQIDQMIKGIDIVFHLAALVGIPYSYHASNSYISTNINGSSNVFHACIKNNVSKIIHTSTSEVYGTAQYTPIDESHPLVGQSPYSATKISADMLLKSYSMSFGLPAAILRPFNNYGPRQSARAIIPTIINQAINKEKVELGNPNSLRDFVFVKDTARGFLALAESEFYKAEVLNLSYGKQISIRELSNKILELTGNIDKELIFNNPERVRPDNSEVRSLLGDYSRLSNETGWNPETKLDDGLSQTIDFVQAHQKLFSSLEYQI